MPWQTGMLQKSSSKDEVVMFSRICKKEFLFVFPVFLYLISDPIA